MRSLRRRKAVNGVMIGLCAFSVGLALAALIGVLAYTLAKGLPAISLHFLTSLPAAPGQAGGGVSDAVIGTLVLVGLACVIGIPLGLLAGIYVAEFARPWLASGVRFTADVLFGVPSIVTGMFIYTLVVARMGHFSALSGGIALAFIMMPIIARTAEESLKLVPSTLREAGLALGVPLWRTILSVILPAALPGIVTGMMLGIARVAGETAPLLFTALGSNIGFRGLGQPIAALPLTIYRYAVSPYRDWQSQAWGAALLLIALVLLVSGVVRLLTSRRTGRL